MFKKFFLFSFLFFVIIFPLLAVNQSDSFHSDRVIIKISDNAGDIHPQMRGNNYTFGIASLDRICNNIGVTKIERLFPHFAKPTDTFKTDLSRIYLVYFPPEADVMRVIKSFQRNSDIIYAEPYYIRKVCFNPNDPSTNQQYALTNIQAYLAWDYCQGDANVKVCIVDTGMDMDHPDLASNLWVNPGEDLNGNGIIDPGEHNNIDDDNNGKVDDFYGWDFVGNDNNPNDTYGHGTHTAGIASAVTNNGVGIASIGFNVSIMVARVGSGPGITQAIQGVTYAINNGADFISMSYGGGGYSQTEQDLFNYADELGILSIAAAGNYNTTSIFYPAGYSNVMSVAASDQSDHKASFSNYGSWIDITAPGLNIFSTYLNAGYTNMSGTSMSCPMVAGLGALIKSAYPGISADEIGLILKTSANKIDALNPNYQGMLGWGRINGYNAMAMLYSDLAITLTPHNTPIVIPALGGQIEYDRLIQNTSDSARTVILYTLSVLPNGAYYRINTEMNQIIPAGGQIQGTNLNTAITAGAPAGTYTFILIALDAQSKKFLSLDAFTFTKSGTDNSGNMGAWQLMQANEAFAPVMAIPDNISLSDPSPNPFNPETELSYFLPEAGNVSLRVYDIQGREVAVLADGYYSAGTYQIKFNGKDLSSGIYFAVLNYGASNQVKKLTLIK